MEESSSDEGSPRRKRSKQGGRQGDKVCSNCQSTQPNKIAPGGTWLKHPQSKETLCTACYTYQRNHPGEARPSSLFRLPGSGAGAASLGRGEAADSRQALRPPPCSTQLLLPPPPPAAPRAQASSLPPGPTGKVNWVLGKLLDA